MGNLECIGAQLLEYKNSKYTAYMVFQNSILKTFYLW